MIYNFSATAFYFLNSTGFEQYNILDGNLILEPNQLSWLCSIEMLDPNQFRWLCNIDSIYDRTQDSISLMCHTYTSIKNQFLTALPSLQLDFGYSLLHWHFNCTRFLNNATSSAGDARSKPVQMSVQLLIAHNTSITWCGIHRLQ